MSSFLRIGWLLLLVGVFLVLPSQAFLTRNGNEISFIWGFKTEYKLNSSLEWVKRVDYPNGTTINGHFDKVIHNIYTIEVPYIVGITINGKDYYKNTYIEKDNEISIFTIPIGKRNINEFGKCRDYEINKGVCSIK